VVIALVITPEELPLAYEVMEGNTSDRVTLRGFLAKIKAQYGRARRVWVMDRGIPTEEVLAEMRDAERQVFYWWTRRAARCSSTRRIDWSYRGGKCASRWR
jgi:transposase